MAKIVEARRRLSDFDTDVKNVLSHIEEHVYRSVFCWTNNSELAGLVYDDFELIGLSLVLKVQDDWLTALAKSYLSNRFPHGQLEKTHENIEDSITGTIKSLLADNLIQQDAMKQHEAEIRRLIKPLALNFAVNVDDPLYGFAFCAYLHFTNEQALRDAEVTHHALTPTQVFYNKYFWFLIFTKLHEKVHGVDAGIEQQAFQILESGNVDWDGNILEALPIVADETAEKIYSELPGKR